MINGKYWLTICICIIFQYSKSHFFFQEGHNTEHNHNYIIYSKKVKITFTVNQPINLLSQARFG